MNSSFSKGRESIDPNDVKIEFETLCPGQIGYVSYLHAGGQIICNTNKQNYENLWTVSLEHDPSKKSKNSFNNEGYRQIGNCTIPPRLSPYIRKVYLNRSLE